MIIYDLNINTYNTKLCEFSLKYNFYWGNLYITNEYIIFIYFSMVIRWVFSFFFQVKEKNLENNKIRSFCPFYLYDIGNEYNSARNHLVQISDNIFSVYSELYNNLRLITFAEIKIE